MNKTNIIQKIKKDLKEQGMKDVSRWLQNYNPYDDQDIIQTIVKIATPDDLLSFDFVMKDCDSWSMLTYYSPKLSRSIILTYDYGLGRTIKETVENLEEYVEETKKIESRISN